MNNLKFLLIAVFTALAITAVVECVKHNETEERFNPIIEHSEIKR